jgi:hypothetical protein
MLLEDMDSYRIQDSNWHSCWKWRFDRNDISSYTCAEPVALFSSDGTVPDPNMAI